eukprot:736179-Pyramimonas_sp.AAC.1
MAPRLPRRGPKGSPDGQQSAQERAMSAPRSPQEAMLMAPERQGKSSTPLLLIDGLQDGPERPSRASEGPPR